MVVVIIGVVGFDVIILEVVIFFWYDYYCEGGLVVVLGGFQGEDVDVLVVEIFSCIKFVVDY